MRRRVTHIRGFTLVELSVVLVILSVMIVGALTVGKAQLEASRDKQTHEKLESIDRALLIYRKAYDRLPCPADARLATNNVNFGVSAANPGSCVGGTPAVNYNGAAAFIVQGTVPVRTLSLPDDFMFDGWGHRIDYAVDTRMTASNAYIDHPVSDRTVGIITMMAITDSGTVVKTPAQPNGAVMVLVSHGPNGHGAFRRNGGSTLNNAGATSTPELENCSCNATGGFSSFNATYYQNLLVNTDPSTSTDIFDDIVLYRMPWDYRLEGEGAPDYTGPEFSLATSNATALPNRFFSLNKKTNNSFSLHQYQGSNPPGPTSNCLSTAFSGNNNYIAFGHTASPYITVYKRYGTDDLGVTTSAPISAPAFTPPAGQVEGIAFSNNSVYLAAAHTGNPYLSIYRRTGDAFNKLPNVASPPEGNGHAVAISSDDTYLAVGHSTSPFISVYKRSGDTFTELADPAAAPAGIVYGVAFSNDLKYLAAAHASVPYLSVYKRSIDTFTRLADFADMPPSTGQSVAFSPDNKYLAVGHQSSPYVTVYKIDAGDAFTKVKTNTGATQFSNTLPANTANGVAFSSDSGYLGVAQAGGASTVYLYKINSTTDVFTKLANPDSPPTATGYGIGFRH